MRAALVLPVFNEADNLLPLLGRIDAIRASAGLDLDVIAVDDGSQDNSLQVLHDLAPRMPYLRVLRHGRNQGFAAAVRTGLSEGLARCYEVVGLMDADLTHDPAALPALLEPLSDHADVVIGSRYVRGGGMESVPFVRVAISQVGNLAGRILLGLPVSDLTSGYRMFRRAVLETISLDETGFGIQLEAVVKAQRAGFRVVEVPITLRVRTHGYSKMVYDLSFWYSYARLFWRLVLSRPSVSARPEQAVRRGDVAKGR